MQDSGHIELCFRSIGHTRVRPHQVVWDLVEIENQGELNETAPGNHFKLRRGLGRLGRDGSVAD